jgi:tRNA C32,U32 (ribose-2'-O)-methylase TrmJ
VTTQELDALEKALRELRLKLAAKSPSENNMRVLQNTLRDISQRSYINAQEFTIVGQVIQHLRKETERQKAMLEQLEK